MLIAVIHAVLTDAGPDTVNDTEETCRPSM